MSFTFAIFHDAGAVELIYKYSSRSTMVVINIDTQKDSHDEIKKTIQYLQHLLGEETVTEQIKQTDGSFMNIFDDESTQIKPEVSTMNIFDSEPAKNDDVSMSIFNDKTTKELTEDEQDAETLLKTVSEDPEVHIEDDDDDAVIEIVEYD